MHISAKLLLFSTLFLSYIRVHGQQDPPFKRFALQAGINISNMNFNKGEPPPVIHINAAWKPGITLGFSLRVPLMKNLFLQPEYAYTQRKGSDKSAATNYSLNYLSMPVLLNYKLMQGLALVAGPQIEFLVNAKSDDHTVSSNITHDTEERSIAVTAGVELEIKNIFIFSARYLQGLNHIGIGQRSNVKEFKYQAVSLTAGIRF